MASLVSKLSQHGVEFAEALAKKLGYQSAEEAEQLMGAASFQRVLDKEAERGPKIPREQLEATTRDEPEVPRPDKQPLAEPFEDSLSSPDMFRVEAGPVGGNSALARKRKLAAAAALTAAGGTGAAAILGTGGEEQRAATPPPEAGEDDTLAATLRSSTASMVKDLQGVDEDMPTRPKPDRLRGIVSTMEKLRREEPQGDWDTKIDEAKRLYQERATRNEWLSLAQTIGDGLVRLGAAQAGARAGVPVGPIDLGPKVDYEKRTDRSLREYLEEVEGQGKKREAASRAADRDYERRFDTLRSRLGTEQYIYGQDMDVYQDAVREKKLQSKLDKASVEEHAKVVEKEIKDTSSQLEAIQTAATMYNKAEDTSNSKEKAKYLQLAAKKLGAAQLPEEVRAEVEASEDEPGFIGTSKNYKNPAVVLSNYAKNLNESLVKLRSMRGTTAPTAPVEPPPGTKEPTPEQIQKYMTMYGVSSEVATNILRARLNQ